MSLLVKHMHVLCCTSVQNESYMPQHYVLIFKCYFQSLKSHLVFLFICTFLMVTAAISFSLNPIYTIYYYRLYVSWHDRMRLLKKKTSQFFIIPFIIILSLYLLLTSCDGTETP